MKNTALFGAAILAVLVGIVAVFISVSNPHIAFSKRISDQVEIKSKSHLLKDDGTLALAGWARDHIIAYNPDKITVFPPYFSNFDKYRIKESDSYTIFNSNFFFQVVIRDAKYAGLVETQFVDLQNRKSTAQQFTLQKPGKILPSHPKSASYHIEEEVDDFQITIKAGQDGKRTLRLMSRNTTADMELRFLAGSESLVNIIPIGHKGFVYSDQTPSSGVSGRIVCSGAHSTADSFAIFDWSRGVFDFQTSFVKMVGSTKLDDSRSLSLLFGTGIGNETLASSNAVVLNGQIHKLGAVNIAYDPNMLMNPWPLLGDNLEEFVFVPYFEHSHTSKAALLSTTTRTVHGRFSGSVISADGEVIALDGVAGFAQLLSARW